MLSVNVALATVYIYSTTVLASVGMMEIFIGFIGVITTGFYSLRF